MRLFSFLSVTRTELLLFTGFFLVFAAEAFMIGRYYLEKSRLSRAVESARTINTLLSQYATDNNGVYSVGEGTPAAGKSEGIALNLLQNNYAPDTSVFAVGSTRKYIGKATDFSGLSAANLSWDFTAGANSTTGITSTAPDQLPTVYTTGETVSYPTTPGSGLDLTVSGSGPFGNKGIVVAYKGGNAVFIPSVASGTTLTCPDFIPKTFKDTGVYTQIKP